MSGDDVRGEGWKRLVIATSVNQMFSILFIKITTCFYSSLEDMFFIDFIVFLRFHSCIFFFSSNHFLLFMLL